jgi:hypothetical protein
MGGRFGPCVLHAYIVKWNAAKKDDLELVRYRKICCREVPLHDAQEAIRTDWIAAYR